MEAARSFAPQVAAVLVNYNAGDELRAALQSVADEMCEVPWEAAVIDNASSDGSGVIATEFAPRAALIPNSSNVGFARAVNQAIAATTAPLVLIMNPDCRLLPGCVQTLRREVEAHRDCAIAGPRILDPEGAVQGSARGDPDMLTGLFGRNRRLRRLLPGLSVSKRNVLDEQLTAESRGTDVDWVSGACMLARRDALQSVGGFDERYFLYWEDADLCRRLRGAGYRIRYVPAATAVHRVGHSSRTAREASIRAFHDSAYLYYVTHVAPGPLNPKRLLARALLAARCAWALRGAQSTSRDAQEDLPTGNNLGVE